MRFTLSYTEDNLENIPKPRHGTHLPMPCHGLGSHISPMNHSVQNSKKYSDVSVINLGIFNSITCLHGRLFYIGMFMLVATLAKGDQTSKKGKLIPKEKTLSHYPPDVHKGILESRLEWCILNEKPQNTLIMITDPK